MNNDKLTLKREEAAQLIGVGTAKMSELVKRDDFPAVRIGKRKILINKEQFISWFNSLTSNNIDFF